MAKKPTPNLIQLMDTDFRPWFKGESWSGWKSIIRAISALPMSDQDIEFFRSVAGNRQPPKKRPRETWIAAGRRGGKDSAASAIAAHGAAFFDRQDRL
jgi:hypothetical protein